jgi:transcriptional regulator with XRE-family HTH domain
MEKKTMGAFIATLRKANGMTQKELAERLNVSDKTVSRWERDDGAPDLTLIPVLAELFGVTCDELLRGARKPPEDRTEEADPSETSPKGEKQRQHLLKSTLSQYQIRTDIAMGISVVGLLAALLCNLALLQAVLGFFLAAIFYAVSIVCQAVFVNRAFLRVEDAGIPEEALWNYRRKVVKRAEISIGLTVVFLGFTAPLLLEPAYMGLSAVSLLMLGVLGGAAMLLLYAVVLYGLNAALLRKGVFRLTEDEANRYRRNHVFKRSCAIVLVVLLAITCVGHLFSTSIWGPHSIMKGTTFDDYDSFIAFMEQDRSAATQDADQANGTSEDQSILSSGAEQEIFYDDDGNEISAEEAFTHQLVDRNGNVVCTYVQRNQNVISLRYSAQDDTVLPITVCTQADLEQAQHTAATRHVIFGAAYALECLAVVLVYFKKRAK